MADRNYLYFRDREWELLISKFGTRSAIKRALIEQIAPPAPPIIKAEMVVPEGFTKGELEKLNQCCSVENKINALRLGQKCCQGERRKE